MDSTSEAKDGFDQKSLKQIVISPIPRLHSARHYYSFLFAMEGFLLEFFVRSVPFKIAEQRGVLKDAPVLSVPNICLFDVPEIVDLLVAGYGKHDRGLVAFKDQGG